MVMYNITGWGKGKTTSAIGITARALANKESVLFCSFLKDGNDGALQLFSDMFRFNFRHLKQGTEGFTLEDCTRFYNECMDEIERFDPDFIVFDELNVALDNNLIDDDILSIQTELIKLSLDRDIYITGRINNHELRHQLMFLADIASNNKCEAHLYNRTCSSCGMEYRQDYIYCPSCGTILSDRLQAKKGREY